MTTEATPGALGSNDQLGQQPERDGAAQAAMQRMRARFDAHYGELADVMRAALAWRTTWADFQRPYNAAMEAPVTEADVDIAECRMLAAVQTFARGLEPAVEADGLDADRFRWLTEDHADSETRAKCRELLGRLGVMGRGAARADIDSAMAEDIKRSMLRTADAVIAERKTTRCAHDPSFEA